MTTLGGNRRPRENVVPGQPELADFFGVLAARFAYDRGEETRAERHRRRKPQEPPRQVLLEGSRRQRRLVLLTSALICLLMVAVATVARFRPSAELPESILGTWRTSAEGYAHRGFTLTATSLVLNAGPEGELVSTYAITRVGVSSRGAEFIYTIDYLVDGAPTELSLRYSSGPPSVIHLAHQREVAWSQ